VKASRQDTWYALLFLLPFLFILIVFFAFAFIRALGFSFTNYNLFNINPQANYTGEPFRWVGIQNYLQLFREPLFLTALKNTVFYSFVVTAIQTFLALCLATVLNQKIRGINFFRTIYYLPSVLSSAAVTLIFLWLYQKNGFINFAVSWVNKNMWIILAFLAIFLITQAIQVFIEKMQGLPVNFFNPALATISLLLALIGIFLLVTFGVLSPREVPDFEQVWLNTGQTWLGLSIPLWAIIIQNIYTTIPTFMLLYLAGLQDIPTSLYEAASLDGASRWQQFLNVTIPMLRPVTFLIVTMSLIGTLQMFDQVALFGDAAPLQSVITLAFYTYTNVFPSAGESRIGLAAAAAIVLGLLTLIATLLQRRFVGSDKGY
jgi:multiple sugar transport system permease protein